MKIFEKQLFKRMQKAEEETQKQICIGQVFGASIFEQVSADPPKYAIYQQMSDGSWETSEQRSYEGFIPMPDKTPLTHPTKPLEYESENQLFKDVVAYTFKHLDLLNPASYHVFAGFIFSTWINELFDFTPYLGFYGREAVGKTRALEVLKELCFRSWFTSGLTTATLFRLVEKFNPTLLLDESEFLTAQERRELISLLNAGQRRGITVPRMTGEKFEKVEWFSVYSPKCIAGTEQLKKTTSSRMITFTMTRNTRDVPRIVNKEKGLKLRNQLLTWRFHKISQLKDSLSFKEKVAPTFELKATTEYKELEPLSGRTYELFYPLYHSAPTGKTDILQFANELEKIKLAQEKTALSSIIFEAIINLKDTHVERGLLLLKDIAEYINSGQPVQYWIHERRIGTKCGQMGLQKTRTNKGTAIILNEDIIKRLSADPRYSVDLLNFCEESEEGEAKKDSVSEWI